MITCKQSKKQLGQAIFAMQLCSATHNRSNAYTIVNIVYTFYQQADTHKLGGDIFENKSKVSKPSLLPCMNSLIPANNWPLAAAN